MWSGVVRGHNTDLLPRSVPGLVLEQVSLQEKHWQALASGLADCGARLQQGRLDSDRTLRLSTTAGAEQLQHRGRVHGPHHQVLPVRGPGAAHQARPAHYTTSGDLVTSPGWCWPPATGPASASSWRRADTSCSSSASHTYTWTMGTWPGTARCGYLDICQV